MHRSLSTAARLPARNKFSIPRDAGLGRSCATGPSGGWDAATHGPPTPHYFGPARISSVVFAEQPPRLRRVGSQFAVCLSLGGLVEKPYACQRRKPVLALQEDWYAHGRTQLAMGHHRDELVPQLDLVEDPDETVAIVDPTSSGVEEEDHAVQGRPCLPSAARTSSTVPATIGPDKSI